VSQEADAGGEPAPDVSAEADGGEPAPDGPGPKPDTGFPELDSQSFYGCECGAGRAARQNDPVAVLALLALGLIGVIRRSRGKPSA